MYTGNTFPRAPLGIGNSGVLCFIPGRASARAKIMHAESNATPLPATAAAAEAGRLRRRAAALLQNKI